MWSADWEAWQRDHSQAVTFLLQLAAASAQEEQPQPRISDLRRFFVEEQRVFELGAESEERLVQLGRAMRRLFGQVSEILRLELATRLFRLTPGQLVHAAALLLEDTQLRPLLDAEISARLQGPGDFNPGQLRVLRRWCSLPTETDPEISVSVSAADEEEEEEDEYAEYATTESLAERRSEAALKELARRACPETEAAVLATLRKIPKHQRREFWPRWGGKLAEMKFPVFAEALEILWVFVGDAATLERQTRRLALPGTPTAAETRAAAELLEAVAERAAGTSEDKLWRATKTLHAWLVNSVQASEVEVAMAALKFPSVPEISVARLQRLVQTHGPVEGQAETLVTLAKAGAFNEEYWRRHAEFAASDACSSAEETISVFYACAVTLTTTGDLAWTSGLTPERFYVTGGFSEDQRLEHFETTFRIRDLVRKLRELSDKFPTIHDLHCVRLAWALAATRMRAETAENFLRGKFPITDFRTPAEEAEWLWAWAMLWREFPGETNFSVRKFPENDMLLNVGFALVAVGGERASLAPILAELQTRKLPLHQLHSQVRLLHLARHLRGVEIGNFAQAISEHNRRILEKREFARRPMWRQAMQASLATHGIFVAREAATKSAVDVQAAVGMVFPIDAVVKVKTGSCTLGVELDRPLSFFRDERGKKLQADAYTLLTRELLSLHKLENSSITPLRLINIKLDKWAAIPASDIPKQLDFLKATIRHALLNL